MTTADTLTYFLGMIESGFLFGLVISLLFLFPKFKK